MSLTTLNLENQIHKKCQSIIVETQCHSVFGDGKDILVIWSVRMKFRVCILNFSGLSPLKA